MQFEHTVNGASLSLFGEDCVQGMPNRITPGSVDVVVTSPPYNLGKAYEPRLDLDVYLAQQGRVIAECVRALPEKGSICWQVGNYVDNGEIVPLDIVLYPIFCCAGPAPA